MVTEARSASGMQLTEAQKRELGTRLSEQLIDALRATTLRLGSLLELKRRGNPMFDQKAIDEASAHQNALLKKLLEIRKIGIPIDLTYLVKLAKGEKIHEFSGNLVAVTIDANTPGKTPFSVTTRLSEIPVEGGSRNAFELLTLGQEPDADDAPYEDPASYLWRTVTSELFEIQSAKEQVRLRIRTESVIYRQLRDLEFTVIKDRFLEPAANNDLPSVATADFFVKQFQVKSHDPSVVISLSISRGTQLRTPEFKYPLSVIARNDGINALQRIDGNMRRAPQINVRN